MIKMGGIALYSVASMGDLLDKQLTDPNRMEGTFAELSMV